MAQLLNLTLPGNPRYQPKSLQPIFGYDNLYQTVAEVEIATLKTLGEIGVIPPETMALLTLEVEDALLAITTTEVDDVERRVTKHDINAWVRIAKEKLPPPLRRYLHIPLTSYDDLDTARMLQFVRAHQDVVSPTVKNLILILAGMVQKYADTLQIGRTHGQHAIPITVGFWLATILNRIIWNAQKMDEHARGLVGKISGAVGAHNAHITFGFTEFGNGEQTFEERVLEKLGLGSAPVSTQILPPEPLAYYLFSATMLSATIAQLGRDCRHLMRSEIGEVCEPFESSQVGSSTMAHKRNPVNFENSEGMYVRTKSEFAKVLDTIISEHQRDLVGSCVVRDFPIIIVNLTCQLETLLRKNEDGKPFLARIGVDPIACRRNFEMNMNVILAEPIYIALQIAGYEGDAHELVNRSAVPLARQKGIPLLDAVRSLAETDDRVCAALDAIPPELLHALKQMEWYVGDAAQKAIEIADMAHAYIRS